ncbi:MAG: hypothetical protein FWB85_03490 [Chitinispirillia bacterium]|nr:hypothetical protein [Chitinispirillia bacterium]MCL2241457.1 hypothetical protein [Chitinispirillia bacterium]
MKIRRWLAAAAAALTVLICVLLPACGGGFGADSGDTKELEPGIFGPDTSR